MSRIIDGEYVAGREPVMAWVVLFSDRTRRSRFATLYEGKTVFYNTASAHLDLIVLNISHAAHELQALARRALCETKRVGCATPVRSLNQSYQVVPRPFGH